MLLTRRWMGPEAGVAEGCVKAAAAATAEGPPEPASASKARKSAKADTKASVPADTKVGADAKADVKAEVPEAKAKAKGRQARARERKRHREDQAVKDPEAAAAYLQGWATKEEGGSWRFNKATQAWLIRHAYDSERVPKDVFRLLLRYLEGLRGVARDRLRDEAGAIVVLRGAPLAAAEPPPAEGEEAEAAGEDGEATAPPKKRRRGRRAEGAEDGKVEAPADAEPSAAEARTRKLRLRRAKQVLAALGGEAAAEDGEA
mmetsp:Transcript_81486/g.174566  ORF Transcript_81486/g.174566 Transcript_81486/m.174566 type:complete len:260 (-) Transcript_81486:7-786(-)